MAVNEFDQSKGQQYVSTYAPIPLGMIAQLAAKKQAGYDNALDDIEKTKGLLQVKADPNNIQERDKWTQDTNKGIDTFAQRALKEGWTPQLEREWNKYKNSKMNDPNRLNMEESYKQYEAYSKDRQKQVADGTYLGSLDPYMASQRKQGQEGVIPYYHTGLESRLDWDKSAKDVMGKINSETLLDNTVFEYGSDGSIKKIKRNQEGVALQKLERLAQQKTLDYYNSKEGNQVFRHLVNSGMSKEEAFKELTKKLVTANMQQVGINVNNSEDMSWMPGYVKIQRDADKTNTSLSEGINNEENADLSFMNEMKFTSKGDLQIPTKNKPVGSTTQIDPRNPVITPAVDNAQDLNKMKDQVRFIMDIQKQYPELKGLSPKETVEAYKKAHKALSNEAIPLNKITTDAAVSIGKSLARDLKGRTFSILDGTGTVPNSDLATVLDKAGVTEQEFIDKISKEGIGGFTQAGPIPGAYYVNINDRRILISPDNEAMEHFVGSMALNQIRKSFKPGEFYPIQGQNYKVKVTPNISKDGQPSWKYEGIVMNENGEIIKTEELTLDEIRRAERNAFAKSGYLASKLTVMGDQETY